MPSFTDLGCLLALVISLYYSFLSFSLAQFTLIAIALSFVTYLLTSSRPNRRMPPGPAGLPIVGCIPWFIFEDANKYLSRLHKKYGKMFTIKMGSVYNHVISDYETMKEFSNHPDFQYRPSVGALRMVLERRGIVDAEGDVWRHQRRFILHSLRDMGMGKLKLEEKIQDELVKLCTAFEKFKGKPTSTDMLLKKSTCNMIFSLAFNTTFEYDDPNFIQRIERLDQNVKMSTMLQIMSFFPMLLPLFCGQVEKVKKNIDYFINFQSEEFVKEHQANFDPENPRDFIDLFLTEMSKEVTEENKDALKTFNIDQLNYVIADFFLGGTETSSNTIRWALLFMIHYPEIQDKIQAEIEEVVGTARLPKMDDRYLLPLTTATLQEVERLASVVPEALPRSNGKPAEFKGYKFPERSIFQFDTYTIHRDPNHWKNPLDFNPQRFIDKDGKVFRPPYLVPFGSGKRVCVGESMARMEIFLMFATLLQKFTFRPEGNKLPTLDTSLTGFIRTPVPHKLRAIPKNV